MPRVLFFFPSTYFQLTHSMNFIWVNLLLQQQDLVTTARTCSGAITHKNIQRKQIMEGSSTT